MINIKTRFYKLEGRVIRDNVLMFLPVSLVPLIQIFAANKSHAISQKSYQPYFPRIPNVSGTVHSEYFFVGGVGYGIFCYSIELSDFSVTYSVKY